MSGKLLHTRELKNDIYFLEELDDPNYDRKNPFYHDPHEIITVPVYTVEEK
jgi:hypothetical protein